MGDNTTLVGPDNNTVQLLFTTEDWNSDKTVEVTGVADNLSDGDQAYSILLGADNSTGDSSYLYIYPPDVSLRNLDLTDKGSFYVSAISGDTDENLNTAYFTVRLASAPSGDAATDNVTITMASSDTGEGTLSVSTGITGDNASQLVFSSSNWNSVRTVTVTGVADNLSDGDQAYAIQLTLSLIHI